MIYTVYLLRHLEDNLGSKVNVLSYTHSEEDAMVMLEEFALCHLRKLEEFSCSEDDRYTEEITAERNLFDEEEIVSGSEFSAVLPEKQPYGIYRKEIEDIEDIKEIEVGFPGQEISRIDIYCILRKEHTEKDKSSSYTLFWTLGLQRVNTFIDNYMIEKTPAEILLEFDQSSFANYY